MSATQETNAPAAWTGTPASYAAYPVKSMWQGTVLETNSEGIEECFAIGPDGYIWSYETGTPGQPAGRLISTGLKGKAFALGKAGDGSLVVFAIHGRNLRFVHEMGEGKQRWSAPHEVVFPDLPGAMRVTKVVTQSRATNLFVCMLVRHLHVDGTESTRMWDAVWVGNGLVLAQTPAELGKGNSFWMDLLGPEDLDVM